MMEAKKFEELREIQSQRLRLQRNSAIEMDKHNHSQKHKQVGQISIANTFEKRRNTIMEAR